MRFPTAIWRAIAAAILAVFLTTPIVASAAPKAIKFSKKYSPGQIIIDTSDKRLYYVYKRGKAFSYPVATPRLKSDKRYGKTRITQKRPNPTWRPTNNTRKKYKNLPAVVKPGDPKNAMGVYAMNLTWRYIRIHGTNNPRSIGSAASGGCYRMYNSHVTHLAKRVRVGTRVTVRR